MSCNFQAKECKNLEEGLQGPGILFAADWARGSAAKKFFLATCQESHKDYSGRVEEKEADIHKRRHNRQHVCDVSHLADFLVKKDLNRYEVLQADHCLRLFFDVEWPVEGVGDEADSATKLMRLQQCVREYGQDHNMFKDSIVLDASRCGKKSYHIIYHNAVFRRIDGDLKIFVLGFVRWLTEDMKLNGLTYVKKTQRGEQLRCIVDTAVYTKHRCFRLLGQSKASDKKGTTLVPYKSDSVIAKNTLVQSTALLCDHEAYIDDLLKYRAPTDGLYPIAPSPDFGHGARQKGTVCFRKVKRQGKVQLNIELDVPKKLGRLVIENDEDILNNLDCNELKQADFTGLFLPVLISLTTAFSDKELIAWMGGTSKDKSIDKINKRLTYAKQRARDDTVALVKCEAALSFLKKKHVHVVDTRPHCAISKPLLQVIDPKESEGWKFLPSGVELKGELSQLCKKDKQSRFQRRRSIFISGKMGVGKTAAVLYFAKERLTEDVYKDVTYFGPRTLLVKQVSERMEETSLLPTVHKRKGVSVRRYYAGMDDDAIYRCGLIYRDVTFNSNYFHAACINSAAKTPLHPDVVIVDEAVVSVGNMFIHSTQSAHRSKNVDNVSEKAIECDRDVIEAVIERIRNASVVIYIDAAFTHQLVSAFSLIWSTAKPLNIENYADRERKSLQTSLTKAGKREPCVTFHTDKTGAQKFEVAENVLIAVYDPGRDSGVFTQLREVINYQQLKMEVMETIYNKKSCIVYTSSSRAAAEVTNMVKRKGTALVPMMTLVTSEFVKKNKNLAKCIADMGISIFVAASSVLSCGVSFDEQDMFDYAYAMFEFSPNTPPLADMIQLCARVRSISSKTLTYTVISKGAQYYAANNDPQNIINLRQQKFASSPVLSALHTLNADEHKYHINMCRQRGYAAACVRNGLWSAFTHIKDPSKAPVVPKYTLVEPHVMSSNLPTRWEISLYNTMCSQLPAGTTYTLFSTSKRPMIVTRNDLPGEAYPPALSYALSAIETKNGTPLLNVVTPIPLKKRKRESPSGVNGSEDSPCSEVGSEVGSTSHDGNLEEETSDEFECRGDI